MKKQFLLAVLMIIPLFSGTADATNSTVPTAPFVNLDQYLGKWYEVASIPQSFQSQCVKNTTAEYSQAEKGRIKVLNSCATQDGTVSAAEGRAKVVDTESNAKLKVTFVKIGGWFFAFGGNYWVMDIAEDYSLALVADPSAEYAWILSRTPAVSKEVLAQAESKFAKAGYDTCRILTSVQDGGISSRVPLCDWVR